ncbi:MAG: hypothetical protein LBJ00_07160 [Planctomycetaceae bacterium]|nr:hypothetical protein [Planctomycetaceae bacterium]
MFKGEAYRLTGYGIPKTNYFEFGRFSVDINRPHSNKINFWKFPLINTITTICDYPVYRRCYISLEH